MIETGVDLVEIKRMERAVKSIHFVERVFSAQERALFEKKKNPVPTMAANFAAKEAFSKALGTGVRGFSLTEVSALRDELGRPFLYLTGRAEEIARERKLSFSISMSHTKEYAVCFVVAFTKDCFE